MKIIIESPGIKVQSRLTRFVEQHIGKLGSLYPQIMDAWVCLKSDASDNQENKVCDIRLSVSGNDLFASKRSEDFEESVVKTINALKNQLKRNKREYVNRTI